MKKNRKLQGKPDNCRSRENLVVLVRRDRQRYADSPAGLRRLRANPSKAYRMIEPKVAVPIPSSLNTPNCTEKFPAPMITVMAATIRLRLSLKSTLLTTHMRAPVMTIRPNTTTEIGRAHV